MNEGKITGTLTAIRNPYLRPKGKLYIEVDRKQYGKIKKHMSDFAHSKQMCFRTTKLPCFTRIPVGPGCVQFIIEIRLDKLDDAAEFESLEKVEVRYKLRCQYWRKLYNHRLITIPRVRAKLLSIAPI